MLPSQTAIRIMKNVSKFYLTLNNDKNLVVFIKIVEHCTKSH
jgi:hypothetical protein